MAGDGRRVLLEIPGLKEEHVVYVKLNGVVDRRGTPPWSTEVWYTLNRFAERDLDNSDFHPRPFVIRPVAAGHEAEDAERHGPALSSQHGGFTGTGFVDFGSTTGESLTFTIAREQAGSASLTFRYANGSGPRPCRIEVNGAVAGQLDFDQTGGWSSWGEASLDADLAAGVNTVSVISVGPTGPNIDALVLPGALSARPAGAASLDEWRPASGERLWPEAEGVPHSRPDPRRRAVRCAAR